MNVKDMFVFESKILDMQAFFLLDCLGSLWVFVLIVLAVMHHKEEGLHHLM